MDRILTRPMLKFEYQDKEEKYYSLKKPLIFEYNKKTYVINPNDENGVFLFNLASVPWYLYWLHKPNSKQTLYPSIIHDFRYSLRSTSRYIDDKMFKSLTKSEQNYYLKKIKTWKKYFLRIRYFITRWVIFGLLRVFGSANKAN